MARGLWVLRYILVLNLEFALISSKSIFDWKNLLQWTHFLILAYIAFAFTEPLKTFSP